MLYGVMYTGNKQQMICLALAAWLVSNLTTPRDPSPSPPCDTPTTPEQQVVIFAYIDVNNTVAF